MSSTINESTPINYDIKVDGGFNIAMIEQVKEGDTLSFYNVLDARATLSFDPPLSGFMCVTIAPNSIGIITVTDVGGEYRVTDDSVPPREGISIEIPIEMKIKMGGRTEDRSRRTTGEARPGASDGGGDDGE